MSRGEPERANAKEIHVDTVTSVIQVINTQNEILTLFVAICPCMLTSDTSECPTIREGYTMILVDIHLNNQNLNNGPKMSANMLSESLAH